MSSTTEQLPFIAIPAVGSLADSAQVTALVYNINKRFSDINSQIQRLSDGLYAKGDSSPNYPAPVGPTVPTIPDGYITAVMIADGAVVSSKFLDGVITTLKLADSAVTAAKVAAASIGSVALIDNAVIAGKIAAGAVGVNEIAANSITTVKLAAGAVTANELAANSVTSVKILAGTIQSGNIAAGAIQTGNLAASSVTTNELAALAVTAAKIAANTITATQIAANTITASQIAANTITAGQIAAGTITGTQIAAGTITTSNLNFTPIAATNVIASINASAEGITITGSRLTINGSTTFASGYDPTGKIGTGNAAADVNGNITTINGGKITAGTITTSQLNFTITSASNVVATINASSEGITISGGKLTINSSTTFGSGYDPTGKIANGNAASDVNANATTISGGKITTGSITATQIAASTITADRLTITALSAITANLGTITAGNISLDASGYIRGGQTDYDTGSGFFLGYNGGNYKFSVGNSGGNKLTWDGTSLAITGSITCAAGQFNAAGATFTAGSGGSILELGVNGTGSNRVSTIRFWSDSSTITGYVGVYGATAHNLVLYGYTQLALTTSGSNTFLITSAGMLSWDGGTNFASLAATGSIVGGTTLSCSGSIYTDTGSYFVGANKVVGARGARVPNASSSYSPTGTYLSDMGAISSGINDCVATINNVILRLVAHGLLAP